MSTEPGALSVADIKPKMEFQGTVKRIQLGGAFVDIGLEEEAFLHISQIRGKKIKNVGDVLTEGQQIEVWVQAIEPTTGRVMLTMYKPALLDWNEVSEGRVYSGKVVRIEKFGAFVDIGAGRPGLVHISEMDADYVDSAEDKVKKGDDVQVKVLRVNREKGQIDLSMKAVDEAPVEAEAEEEEAPTAIALALHKAMNAEAKPSPRGGEHGASKKQERARMDDILRRTLEMQEKQ